MAKPRDSADVQPTSPPLSNGESNCDELGSEDGRKSVRDMKFVFENASTKASEPKQRPIVVFNTFKKSRESSTDCLDDIKSTMGSEVKTCIKGENKEVNIKESQVTNTDKTKLCNGAVNEEQSSVDVANSERSSLRASTVINSSFSFLPTADGDNDSKEETNIQEHDQKSNRISNALKLFEGNQEAVGTMKEDKKVDQLPKGPENILRRKDKPQDVDNVTTSSETMDTDDQHKQTRSSVVSKFITDSFNFLPQEDELEEDDEALKDDPFQEDGRMDTDNGSGTVSVTQDSKIEEGANQDELKGNRGSEYSRTSKLITNSFSFLPPEDELQEPSEDPQDDVVDANEEQSTEDTVVNIEEKSTEDTVVNNEGKSTEDTAANNKEKSTEDTGVNSETENAVQVDELSTSDRSTEVKRSSSLSSTSSDTVLRSDEKRDSLHKLSRQSSRKGIITDDKSKLSQDLSHILRLSDVSNSGSSSAEGSPRGSIGSQGSPNATLRRKSKVNRSPSSGSHDGGSRTMERLKSRSRSNSPGYSDGSDDDEDDDDGIYAESFRYSSYIFVGDHDMGELSFSSSTPDLSTLARKPKRKKSVPDPLAQVETSETVADSPEISVAPEGQNEERKCSVGVVVFEENNEKEESRETGTRLEVEPEELGSRLTSPSLGEDSGTGSVSSLDISRDSTFSRSSAFSETDDALENMPSKGSRYVKNHQRSESVSTTLSEKEFRNRYQAQSKRDVQRSDSTISYKRQSQRFYEVEKTVNIVRRTGDKGFGFHVRGSCPVIVSFVEKGSAAERGGLRVGDVILEVDGLNAAEMSGQELKTIIKPDTPSFLVGVAEDSTALGHLDSGAAIKTGYMHKQGGSGLLKNWKKRWFSLHRDNCLYYYKTHDDSDPLGAILLTNYTVSRANEINRPHCFKISKYDARTYYFQAKDETEMTSWAEKIQGLIKTGQTGESFLTKSSHNVSLPACSIKDPCCHGYLTKLGNRRKTWKRRYCVLKDACMYYYLDIGSGTAQGVAHFHGYTIEEGLPYNKRFGFTLVPPESRMRTYYFFADGEVCYERWMSSLKKSIARWVKVPDH